MEMAMSCQQPKERMPKEEWIWANRNWMNSVLDEFSIGCVKFEVPIEEVGLKNFFLYRSQKYGIREARGSQWRKSSSKGDWKKAKK